MKQSINTLPQKWLTFSISSSNVNSRAICLQLFPTLPNYQKGSSYSLSHNYLLCLRQKFVTLALFSCGTVAKLKATIQFIFRYYIICLTVNRIGNLQSALKQLRLRANLGNKTSLFLTVNCISYFRIGRVRII